MQLPAATRLFDSPDALALGVLGVPRRSRGNSHARNVSSHPRFVMSHAAGGGTVAC